MKSATKALLLSALVFPGVGHLAIARPARGALYLLPALAAFGYLLVATVVSAMDVYNRIIAQSGVLSAQSISTLLAESPMLSGAGSIALLFMLCWLAATVDAWYCGRKLDAPLLEL